MTFTVSEGSRTGGLFKCLIRLLKNGVVGHTGMIIAMSGTLSTSNFARHLFKRENVGYAYGSYSFIPIQSEGIDPYGERVRSERTVGFNFVIQVTSKKVYIWFEIQM